MKEWIEEEMGALDLGDERLNRRARHLLGRLWENPQASPKGAMGTHAEMRAAYRFFENPRCQEEAILKPHRQATLERVKKQELVLVIQDTTELDYSRQKKMEGSGPLSVEARQGFFMHSQWVVSGQRLPLGMWQTQIYARHPKVGVSKDRKQKPIEEKESYRWLEGYRQACALAQEAPQTRVVSVSDREGDIYEVFTEGQERRRQGLAAADFVIRCKENRVLSAEPGTLQKHLLPAVEHQPVIGGVWFEVRAKEQLKKKHGNRKKTFRQARRVRQIIRVGQVTLRPPWRKGRKLPPVSLWVLQATEVDPPADQDPIHWVILTSLKIGNLKEALEVLRIYMARWEIEVFHRVLKSGCRVEKLQLKAKDRIKPALALYVIVAWRILYLMKLGRQCPQLDCDWVFAEAEWKSLSCVVHGRDAPRLKPTLGQMVTMVAGFGGYKGRKGDGPPGPESIWRGLQALHYITLAWETFGPDTS